MRLDRFTLKAEEALQNAKALAGARSHLAINGAHLMLALIEQPDGLVAPVLQSLGVGPAGFAFDLKRELGEQPCVSADTECYLSDSLRQAVESACSEAGKLGDEFISTEHLLLGLLNEPGSILRQVLQAKGPSRDGYYRF